ncbi:MAG TPA: DNA-processing protein DprA [Gemmatimonadaceae bacterium]|nr:DNA-processing protein DprA [Gemmatimonadaceae bacterium]
MHPRGETPRAITIIARGDGGYPAALLELRHPPEKLYAVGDRSSLAGAPDRMVAIVGTRDASPYGVRVASELAKVFARAGIGVVSGLARGVDAAAHRAALGADGTTVAVLGTGVDVPYPAAHRALHSELAEKGLVLSEFEPGASAAPGSFPRRNRIIAALARATIVVEAPYKSGAINTATQALELGRVVAAVPGQIDSGRSAGANQLLRDGAQVIATLDDALGLFGESRGKSVTTPVLGELEAIVWNALEQGAAAPELLGARAGIPVRRVLEGVARLEISGLVQQTPTGEVERVMIL